MFGHARLTARPRRTSQSPPLATSQIGRGKSAAELQPPMSDDRFVNRPAVPLARHLLRVRDLIDRAYAEPLDVAALARSAAVSSAYFSRSFKAAFGETPHHYLMTRRIERAKALLRRGDQSVTAICFAVGFNSLGSFSTQFKRFVGESPSSYRARDGHDELARLPHCYVQMWTRPFT
jgi:AraC-like DNA-binding protein